MKTSNAKSLSWPEVLSALRACSGELVLIRDGKVTERAAVVRSRPAAKGTELCLFPGEPGATRLELIRQLETLAGATGRRFTKSARASIGNAYLLVESVGDAMPSGIVHRPKRGFELPFETWMKGELRAFCAHHLEGLGRLGLIQREPVDALWRSFLSGDGRTTWSRPWTLVAFAAWRERNAIGA